MSTSETRTVATPRTGTKVALLAGLPLLAAALYFFWVPVVMQTPTGSMFNCGRAISGYDSAFQRGTCGDLLSINKFRGITTLGLGLLLPALGAAMFGFARREERRDDDDDRRSPRSPADDEGDLRGAPEGEHRGGGSRPASLDRRDHDEPTSVRYAERPQAEAPRVTRSEHRAYLNAYEEDRRAYQQETPSSQLRNSWSQSVGSGEVDEQLPQRRRAAHAGATPAYQSEWLQDEPRQSWD